jgi:hypothetical protein
MPYFFNMSRRLRSAPADSSGNGYGLSPELFDVGDLLIGEQEKQRSKKRGEDDAKRGARHYRANRGAGRRCKLHVSAYQSLVSHRSRHDDELHLQAFRLEVSFVT